MLGIINMDYESWLGKRKKVDFGLSKKEEPLGQHREGEQSQHREGEQSQRREGEQSQLKKS